VLRVGFTPIRGLSVFESNDGETSLSTSAIEIPRLRFHMESVAARSDAQRGVAAAVRSRSLRIRQSSAASSPGRNEPWRRRSGGPRMTDAGPLGNGKITVVSWRAMCASTGRVWRNANTGLEISFCFPAPSFSIRAHNNGRLRLGGRCIDVESDCRRAHGRVAF